jgi:penicillin-binding protein-related factor A (putative recombinase)
VTALIFFQQQNLIHFCSARALNYFKKDRKMLAAFPFEKISSSSIKYVPALFT